MIGFYSVLLLVGFISLAGATPTGAIHKPPHPVMPSHSDTQPHLDTPPPIRQLSTAGSQKGAFMYVAIGSNFLPADDYRHSGTSLDIEYGGHIDHHNFFSLGPEFELSIGAINLDLKYGYDFFGYHKSWSPGFNLSVLISHRENKVGSSDKTGENVQSGSTENLIVRDRQRSLHLGLKLGGYFRANLSSSHVVFLNVGALHYQPVSISDEGGFDVSDIEMTIQLGLMWHF